MRFNLLNRKIHYWASAVIAAPILVILCTGALLQLKKHWTWVQPAEQRGTGTSLSITLEDMLASVRAVPDLQVRGWQDVRRVDVRPDRGVAKVWLQNGWESQVDLGTGRVLQTAYRRSDIIESIHDGSWFGGEITKLGIFLPTGLVLLLLWFSGVWMFWSPILSRRRRKAASTRPLKPRDALCFALLSLPATAAAEGFEGARAVAIVQEIADDSFAGRFSGLASGRKIEDYVAGRFAEWQLAPAGIGGTFFHEFPLLVTEERAASMSLLNGIPKRVDFLYADDFTLVTNSGSGDVTAEVVIVGRGLSSPDRKWDDYADLDDLAGKILLIVRGTPDNGYDWGLAGSRDSTLHEAARRGAAAVLFFSEGRPVQGAAVHEGSYFPKLPSAIVGDRVMQHLLLDTGWDWTRYQKSIKEAPAPLATGKRVRFRAKVARVPDGRARNVLGLVRGSDPRLADEIIVIGGHMDHVGVNGERRIYNGANDNGSGTCVVMELARTFAASRVPTARTLVFATFAAEEQGLLGSEALVAQFPFDLDRVVAMINMDMVGHGNGKVGLGGGEHFPEIRAAFVASLDSSRADSLVIGRGWRGESSDFAPFLRAGVPTMNISSEGDHRFYHRHEDDPDWIGGDVLGSVGRAAEGWIRTLADWPETLRAEHRAGRTMLRAADQVDFDGVMRDGTPSWVRGSVHWLNPVKLRGGAFFDSLAALHRRSTVGEASVVRKLKDVRDASKSGKRAALLGVRASGKDALGEARRTLLAQFEVACVGFEGAAGVPDSAAIAELVKEEVMFVAPPGSPLLAKLPADAKRCVRLFPGRGESVAEPDSLPRKGTLFVVAVEERAAPADIARVIRSLAWDRVHLDLVPWLAGAPEPALHAFLEELQVAGGFSSAQMGALLGGNLARL